MIGNAVPPRFSKCLANAVHELFMKYDKNGMEGSDLVGVYKE